MISDFIEIWTNGEDIFRKVVVLIVSGFSLFVLVRVLKSIKEDETDFKRMVKVSVLPTIIILMLGVGMLILGTVGSGKAYVVNNIEDYTKEDKVTVDDLDVREFAEGNCEIEYDRGDSFHKVDEIDCDKIDFYDGDDPILYEREKTIDEYFGIDINDILEEEDMKTAKIEVPNK